jgi:hypothetical protein
MHILTMNVTQKGGEIQRKELIQERWQKVTAAKLPTMSTTRLG